MEEKGNVIVKLTFQFSLDIIKYCEGLQEDKKYVIANQLLNQTLQLEPTSGKHRTQKAGQTLYINLKSQLKKLKKQSIG